MKKRLTNFIPVLMISILPTLLIWVPFFFRVEKFWNIPLTKDGMATIVANYDGPLYIVVAKTLYNPQMIKDMFSFNLPTQYYAAHFPLFPVLIKPFAPIFGFPYAMLFVTVLSSFLAIYFFNIFISQYFKKSDALWLTFVFSIFPARWLIVRSVGSAEPLFIACIIATAYYFQNKKYWKAGIWGVLATLTKSPGILLFLALTLAVIAPNIKKLGSLHFDKWIKSLKISSFLPILTIPLSLISVFIFYKLKLNDFFAYFHSGDNIHLLFPPFQIFNYSADWVGTFWLEEIIFVYLFGILGLIKLIQQQRNTAIWIVGIFFFSLLFVSHRDVIRYSLPISPFLILAYGDTIIKREFKIALAVLIIPIYLFSLAYISQNVMQISDWGPLL